MTAALSGCAVYLAIVLTGFAAEPEFDPKELPRIPPTQPDNALATFKIKPGFRIDLVAAEPLVVDPIAMSFDENGRLFVVEMRDYSERRPERLGRIRLLEDTDGDGRFDKSTVFAENLPWPTAVFCYGGGVFVGATPDIFYFKDTNGDGVADMKEVVFTGFASDCAPYETNRLNVQAMLNSFNWGLDNRIHGVTSMSGGKVRSLKAADAATLDLRGRDFAFDPRTFVITAEAGGGQHGMSFDNTGRRFVCSNSDHIQTMLYEDRYAARNPFFASPNPRLGIAVDGPAAEVYRLSPEEPWRVIRTRWRATGVVPGLIEGGGRSSGYFTGATGITIYRGNAWPEEFLGDAFIADCGSNLIHRKKLRPDGVALKAERPAGEEKVEFLASTDNWFRPVQFANAPDGTLYVADMYREIIEHPWSLPQPLKQHLDLNSGSDRGRIYRVVPDGFRQAKPPRLGQAATSELVKTLEHANGWHRDTAARLLYERQDKAAVPLLAKLLAQARSPLGRLHALYALDGLQALAVAHVVKGLEDPDAAVRRHAVRLSEKLLVQGRPSDGLWQKLRPLAADADANVRYQLAFTLGEIKQLEGIAALADIARRDHASSWVRAALMSSLATGAGELFARLVADADFLQSRNAQEFLGQLAAQLGAQNQPVEISRVVDFVATKVKPPLSFSVLRALGDGLQRAGSSLQRVELQPIVKPVFTLAKAVVKDKRVNEAVRVEALSLLGLTSFDEAGTNLLAMLELEQTPAVQAAAVSALARFNDAHVPDGLLRHWATFTPRVRDEAIKALLARSERVRALLAAIETGTVLRSELSATQIEFLRTHRDAEVQKSARQLFNNQTTGQRQSVVDGFMPALQLRGDAAHGKEIYLTRCATCHRLAGQGFVLGPDLASVKSTGKEIMLISILDPNREVLPNYLNYLVETKSGESQLGLIATENATSVTLRQANGIESTVLRSQIASIKSQGQSVMPEGLEADFKPQDMADLLEYIVSVEEKKK